MTVDALTPVVQDYLKVIWSLTQESDQPATSRLLSRRLGVSPSTVSETLRRLTDQDLVAHVRYGSIELTDAGRAHAVAMVRRHRLLETFLAQSLGYSWDEVHVEAEMIEHAVSDVFVERLDEMLGHPRRDPHGDPIPDADGVITHDDGQPLSGLLAGDHAVVTRISDSNAELLRHLATLGVGLDARLTVTDRAEAAGTLTVTTDKDVTVTLALMAADKVSVVLAS